jgi:hypothetical protein
MTEEEEIDLRVKNLMFDIMLVLYNHGIKEINVGGLMRMLGVNNSYAAEHDEKSVELTDEFAKYVKESRETKRPDDATLH